MAATPHLLLVTLPHEDRVAVIDTATLTVTQEISTVGDHPHSVIMAEGD
jgi:YVTN family beta-propeller protein